MKPVFMDVADVLEAWEKAAKQNPNTHAEPPVQESRATVVVCCHFRPGGARGGGAQIFTVYRSLCTRRIEVTQLVLQKGVYYSHQQ